MAAKRKKKIPPSQSGPGSSSLVCSLEQKLPALLKTKVFFLRTYSKIPESYYLALFWEFFNLLH